MALVGTLYAHRTNPQSRAFSSNEHRRGAAKRGVREFRRYLDISLGSLSELSYLLRFSKDCGVLDEEDYMALDILRSEAGLVTWRLYSCMLRAAVP